MIRVLQPAGWPRPKGYSLGVVAAGRLVFLAGTVGWNENEVFETGDFVGQARQALANIVAVLREAGAGPGHVCRLTWFIADRAEYDRRKAELGAAYQAVMGRHYPPMTVVEVSGFVEDGACVEIEATAVIPA